MGAEGIQIFVRTGPSLRNQTQNSYFMPTALLMKGSSHLKPLGENLSSLQVQNPDHPCELSEKRELEVPFFTPQRLGLMNFHLLSLYSLTMMWFIAGHRSTHEVPNGKVWVCLTAVNRNSQERKVHPEMPQQDN